MYIDLFFIWTHRENSPKNLMVESNIKKTVPIILISSLLISSVKQVSIS